MLGEGNQIKPWLDVAYRRRYWILVPGLLGLVGGLVALSQIPKVYLASTTILVTPQRVPENFVHSTVTSRLEDRVATLSVSVLSRAYLEPVAREFKLIGPQAKEGEISATVFRLAGTVRPELDPMRPPKWFKIYVEDGDPILAAGVANALASAFIEENTKLREGQASTAVATAQKFLGELKAQLDQKEAELANYKKSRLLELPDQFGANMGLLQSTQTQITQLDSAIRGNIDKIANLRLQASAGMPVGLPVTGGPIALDPATARYQQLQRELADLELRYTDTHPDVTRKREELNFWVKANPHVTAPPAPAGADDQPKPTLSPIDLQIAALNSEIKKLEAQKARLEAQIGTYQARITSAPSRAQEMEGLTRGLETLRAEYNTWLQKESDAKRSLTMEADNQGEQFQIRDVARVPVAPYKPVPFQVIMMGLGVGLGLGAGVSFLLEFLDNSVRTEEEFITVFPELPLLAAIPDLDRSARRKRKSSGRRAAALSLIVLVFFI